MIAMFSHARDGGKEEEVEAESVHFRIMLIV